MKIGTVEAHRMFRKIMMDKGMRGLVESLALLKDRQLTRRLGK
jgi:hypothetical protein